MLLRVSRLFGRSSDNCPDPDLVILLYSFVRHQVKFSLPDIRYSSRFHRFRQLLDCEMKMCTREGIGLASKKNEKEAITEEEEDISWAV